MPESMPWDKWSIFTKSRLPVEKWLTALNANLPVDVAVTSAQEVGRTSTPGMQRRKRLISIEFTGAKIKIYFCVIIPIIIHIA